MSSTTGSCLCGAIRISYTGEPKYTAICHCADCRKMSTTQVFQVPEDCFRVEAGEPKVYTKTSDHGREIHTHICPNCGTALFRTGGSPNVAGLVGLRAGVLDDQSVVNERAPMMEVYVEKRPQWMAPVPGATMLSGRYEVVERGGETAE